MQTLKVIQNQQRLLESMIQIRKPMKAMQIIKRVFIKI